jgi:hypothetical protein
MRATGRARQERGTAGRISGRQVKFAENAPKTMKASMAHDLERGTGLSSTAHRKVVALGREPSVPTPTNDVVYAVLSLLHGFATGKGFRLFYGYKNAQGDIIPMLGQGGHIPGRAQDFDELGQKKTIHRDNTAH